MSSPAVHEYVTVPVDVRGDGENTSYVPNATPVVEIEQFEPSCAAASGPPISNATAAAAAAHDRRRLPRAGIGARL
jgi:hypothetical protein